mmetsp:Transcript_4561/g.15735  ORF Transcript_4561/g.15735 Transcript_4561/m.15735 type:complete len:213 (-) Transcript_4561:509-1147(-)
MRLVLVEESLTGPKRRLPRASSSLSDVSESAPARRPNLPVERARASMSHLRITMYDAGVSATSSKRSRVSSSLSESESPPPPWILILPPIALKRLAVRGVRRLESCSMSHMRLCSRKRWRKASLVISAVVRSSTLRRERRVDASSSSFCCPPKALKSVGSSSSPIIMSSRPVRWIVQMPARSATMSATRDAPTHSASVTAATMPSMISSNGL